MMRRASILLFVFVLAISSCQTEELIPLTGDIVGYVHPFDEDGITLADQSGVTISLDDKFTAQSDANGKFEFHDVPAGNYLVTCTKDGFGTYKIYNFTHVGGSRPALIGEVILPELPGFSVSNINVSGSGAWNITVKSTIDERDRYRFNYYFSRTNDVSFEEYDYFVPYFACCVAVTNIENQISLVNGPFVRGERIYMRVYSINYHSNLYDYYNPLVDKFINPSAVEWSEPIEVTVP